MMYGVNVFFSIFERERRKRKKRERKRREKEREKRKKREKHKKKAKLSFLHHPFIEIKNRVYLTLPPIKGFFFFVFDILLRKFLI